MPSAVSLVCWLWHLLHHTCFLWVGLNPFPWQLVTQVCQLPHPNSHFFLFNLSPDFCAFFSVSLSRELWSLWELPILSHHLTVPLLPCLQRSGKQSCGLPLELSRFWKLVLGNSIVWRGYWRYRVLISPPPALCDRMQIRHLAWRNNLHLPCTLRCQL